MIHSAIDRSSKRLILILSLKILLTAKAYIEFVATLRWYSGCLLHDIELVLFLFPHVLISPLSIYIYLLLVSLLQMIMLWCNQFARGFSFHLQPNCRVAPRRLEYGFKFLAFCFFFFLFFMGMSAIIATVSHKNRHI